ncbi:DUF488 domain-containing protein [Moorena sp. SIO4G3]|uniref:DUF488 domain-containing protein n=1 Tax=Moorena sp. SIO4G3 TaxID=2607821 RepID=UPI00142A4E77|nr:DUF488 domain-containing protein [Moorena sp. SIO4G3]NEO81114.1 DUF488 domain-containing protein [Moorena sp. SIO4G3]
MISKISNTGSNTGKLFTIGHSNLSIEDFIALLKHHGITAVADVRSHPYSRYLPHFSQAPLKAELLSAGIRYVFLGKELGARPADLSCYVGGKALYEKIAATDLFSAGLKRVIQGAETYQIALMCAEKDPITCHRTILVCQHLVKSGLVINHILNDGSLESHQDLEERLLSSHGLNDSQIKQPKQLSLFDDPTSMDNWDNCSREDRLKEVYHRQGDTIAYLAKGIGSRE